MAGNDEAEAALRDTWVRFRKSGGGELRDRLILHYSPLVSYVAGRIRDERLTNIEQADLFYYGSIGLIDAIQKFDLDRVIKFETYATSRIRGAIMDEFTE